MVRESERDMVLDEAGTEGDKWVLISLRLTSPSSNDDWYDEQRTVCFGMGLGMADWLNIPPDKPATEPHMAT